MVSGARILDLIDVSYIAVCPLAYVLAGTTKLILNSLKEGHIAVRQIGLGGIPSTHTSIASAPVWLILFQDGLATPALAVAVGLLMIVAIDAMDLRARLGNVHSLLKTRFPKDPEVQRLRDRVGHSPLEVACGVIAGGVSALVMMYVTA